MIKQTKAPKKGGMQGKKLKYPRQRRQKEPPKWGKPQGEHQVFEPPPIARSISNKEREKRVPE